MTILNLNDINIYYELHGQSHPLVLIAGYTCDHTFWLPILDKLTAKFQVLIFDNRGVGQTKDNGIPFTLETMAEDVMALIQELGLIRPHILGHSMGGAVAQIIAQTYPDKINKLMILNSTAKINVRTRKVIENLLNLRKKNIPSDLLIETSMLWCLSSDYLTNPENIIAFKQAFQNNPYPQTVEDQERQLKALLAFDSNHWLHAIKTPTLVVAAEDDIVDLPLEGQQLKEWIPNAEFKLTSGGHVSPIEQPSQVAKIILNFLENMAD